MKVVAHKPPDVVDGCWTGPGASDFIAESQFLGGRGTSACNILYPGYLFPRFIAGMPLSNDIVKCRLGRISMSDYQVTFTQVTFTPEERARLYQIFPQGVCDYTLRGVDQRDVLDTWLTYPEEGKFRAE